MIVKVYSAMKSENKIQTKVEVFSRRVATLKTSCLKQ